MNPVTVLCGVKVKIAMSPTAVGIAREKTRKVLTVDIICDMTNVLTVNAHGDG